MLTSKDYYEDAISFPGLLEAKRRLQFQLLSGILRLTLTEHLELSLACSTDFKCIHL